MSQHVSSTAPAPSPPAASSGKRAYVSNILSSFAGRAQNQLANLNEIPHSLRQAGASIDPRQSPYTLKLQLLIKAHKGVVIDTEALGRETHSLSKQLFLWAQDQSVDDGEQHIEGEDLKDVGDRLAFLIYKSGDLQMDLAKQLERSRIELKDIRNFENDLTKSRDRRKALEAQILKLQADPKPKSDQADRIASLSSELHTLTTESSTYEASLAVLKRQKLRSAFSGHFAALRELGEKLSLLSGYGELLLEELETDEQGVEGITAGSGYEGKERTAWIRGAAAEGLASYQGPLIKRPQMGEGSPQAPHTGMPTSDLHRSDTRSFGETHRHELAALPTPPPAATPSPSSHLPAELHSAPSPHGGVSTLNHNPVPIASSMPPPLPARRPSSATEAFSQPSSSVSGSSYLPAQVGHHPGQLSSSLVAGMDDPTPASQTIPPPPAGADPTVVEIGGKVPTGTGGPASGVLPPRRPRGASLAQEQQGTAPRPLTKAEEAARETEANRRQGWSGGFAAEGPGGGAEDLGRMASTSRRPDEDLPAYTEMENEGGEPLNYQRQ